eukprot:1468738-Lingulodinium_polyedra.AAC.1
MATTQPMTGLSTLGARRTEPRGPSELPPNRNFAGPAAPGLIGTSNTNGNVKWIHGKLNDTTTGNASHL